MRAKGKRYIEKDLKIKKTDSDKYFDSSKSTKKKKKNRHFVSNFIILVCLIVIAFSVYKIIFWAIENNKNNSILGDLRDNLDVTHEEVQVNDLSLVKTNYNFTSLLEKNSKVVGWVYVPNTNIDYPVVQDNNNDFYLDHSFDNTYNSAGWIFADYICDIKKSQNVIIYGHNRKDASMFGSLKNVLDDNWLSDEKNHYITFANLDETGIYKIFSTFVVNDANVESYLKTDFSSTKDFHSYLEQMKKSSSYKFDTDIENAEKVITLYTCYGMNNQRLLVFAVKVL